MKASPDDLSVQLLRLLAADGPLTSREIQSSTRKSQPTISRALQSIRAEIITLGAGRSTRYAIQKSILGKPGMQPIYWVMPTGQIRAVGSLALLSNDKVHVRVGQTQTVTQNELPWFLTPLHLDGFLGRLQARRLAEDDWDPDPARWTIGQTLRAALSLYEIPGAVLLGDMSVATSLPVLPAAGDDPPAPGARACTALHAALDHEADRIADSLPAGSSAGGEQPKFLATWGTASVIAKFSPPLGTPYGDRWRDLLCAEAQAGQVLADHGFASAKGHLVHTTNRTYLLSERFDRPGGGGRLHVVDIGAVHRGLVRSPYRHWGFTAEALLSARRMSADDCRRIQTLFAFGRLIGNTDMHAGNLSLFVEPQTLEKGLLRLAPAYDMLPMRWRPNIQQRDLPQYAPFDLDERSLGGPAAPVAQDFWSRLSSRDDVSPKLRATAGDMAARIEAQIVRQRR